MILMNKFKKRLTKSVGDLQNAVVVGQGFGQLDSIVETFSTVFIFSWDRPNLKAKNLVFRENFNDLDPIRDISSIFIDLDQIQHLEKISQIWHKNKCTVLIEGNDPIGRNMSEPLYRDHFRCTDQQGIYHIWKRQ
jgi:hypothetical protein